MNSPKPYPEDELDELVRGALRTRVGGKEPPDRVWKQIRHELAADPTPPPRPQVAWTPLALQVALTMVLVMLGGVGLRTLLEPDGLREHFFDVSPSGILAHIGERSMAPAVTGFDDEAESRSLKAYYRPRLVTWTVAKPSDRPSVAASPLVPPNMLRQEERAFVSESLLPLIVEVQDSWGRGPYPW
jgi:hypothetical protein